MGKIKALAIVSMMLIMLLAGCTQNGGSAGDQNGRLVVALADAAANMSSVQKIEMTIDSVRVYSETNGWVNVPMQAKTYDLLELNAANTTVLLVDANVPAGNYSQIELGVQKVLITDANGTSEAKVPSNRFKVITNTKIDANVATAARFDVLASESLHVTGNGTYIFAPVINLETTENASVEMRANAEVRISGGDKKSLKIGMDESGNVGADARIPANASVDIGANGQIEVNTNAGDGTGTGHGLGSTAGDGTASSDSAYTEFKNFVTGLPTYYVAYDLVTSGQASKMKLWLKSDKMREDVSSQGTDTSIYMSGGTFTTCTNAMGSIMCYNMPNSQGAVSTGTDDMKDNVDTLEGKITKLPDRTIAGAVASCFKVEDTKYPYTYCYTADGIPVYTEIVSEGTTTTMTAYEMSKTVDDSVFVLPATPTTLPGYS